MCHFCNQCWDGWWSCTVIWITWSSLSRVLRKAVKLKHSFTHLHSYMHCLTHWGWVMHLCLNYAITNPDNGLSSVCQKAIILINAGLLWVGPIGTNFIEILIRILIFSLQNALGNVACKIVAILSQSQYVKGHMFWIYRTNSRRGYNSQPKWSLLLRKLMCD